MGSKPRTVSLRFPLGVLSHDGAVAYLGDETPDVVALQSGSGRVLWRSAVAGRPIAASTQQVVVARLTAGLELELAALSASDGALCSTVTIDAPFPAWADITLKPDEFFDYRCALEDSELDLQWHAQQRYQGGAPPGPQVMSKTSHCAAGMLHINLTSGRCVAEPREATLRCADASPLPNVAPSAREVCVHGERVFYLLDRGDKAGQTVLCAARRDTGAPIWEFAVRSWVASRPRALRP